MAQRNKKATWPKIFFALFPVLTKRNKINKTGRFLKGSKFYKAILFNYLKVQYKKIYRNFRKWLCSNILNSRWQMQNFYTGIIFLFVFGLNFICRWENAEKKYVERKEDVCVFYGYVFLAFLSCFKKGSILKPLFIMRSVRFFPWVPKLFCMSSWSPYISWGSGNTCFRFYHWGTVVSWDRQAWCRRKTHPHPHKTTVWRGGHSVRIRANTSTGGRRGWVLTADDAASPPTPSVKAKVLQSPSRPCKTQMNFLTHCAVLSASPTCL